MDCIFIIYDIYIHVRINTKYFVFVIIMLAFVPTRAIEPTILQEKYLFFRVCGRNEKKVYYKTEL